MDTELCEQLDQMISELRSTSSVNEKVDIIKEYTDKNGDIKSFLTLVYDGVSRGVTSDSVKEYPYFDHSAMNSSPFYILGRLQRRELTGYKALGRCQAVRMKMGKHAHLFDYLIDGDIQCGVNLKILEKAFNSNLSFKVCLANNMKSLPNWNDGWYVSRKLDGIRCVAMVHSGGYNYLYSRTGKIFTTLGVVVDKIASFNIKNVMLDGEICLGDDDDFQGLMKQINRKDHTIQNPKFKVFDIVDTCYWSSKPPFQSPTYSERFDRLKSLFVNDDVIEVVNHERITDDAHFHEWTEKAEKENWEGLMLRADKPFEAKRTNNLLKYKKFFDAEYVVLGMDIGNITVNSSGSQKELMMSSVSIEHKGSIVNVGSGFTLEQRREFFYDPHKIIGKTITVKYFEETKDQNGNYSLRFPTLKTIHGYGREF